jgi:cytochrome P450
VSAAYAEEGRLPPLRETYAPDRFGQSTNTLTSSNPAGQEFVEAFEYSILGAVQKARLGWVGRFIPDKKLDRSIKTAATYVDTFARRVLDEGKAAERNYVFLNELVNTGATPDVVRAQILSMILGGRDTSAGTLSFLFWHLARRPDIVEKLNQEIGGFGGEKPTWEELKSMKYLNMVIKEGRFLHIVGGRS